MIWKRARKSHTLHLPIMSHHSIPNSQQFYTHRTYFLGCLADGGFELSHISGVNLLWLTAWPCLPRGGPDSLTALWLSSQWKQLCIILYIIVHTFLSYKSPAQRNTINAAQKYGRLWLCHVGWKAYFFLTVLPFFTDTIHFPFITVRHGRAWIGERCLEVV